jgi:hypothetical protein
MNPRIDKTRAGMMKSAVPLVGSENRLWHGVTHLDSVNPARGISN